MADQTCSTCRFLAGPELGQERRRECRALPPGFAVEKLTNEGHAFFAAWPLVRPADGCGAHQAVAAVAADADGSVVETADAADAGVVVARMAPPEEGKADDKPKGRKKG